MLFRSFHKNAVNVIIVFRLIRSLDQPLLSRLDINYFHYMASKLRPTSTVSCLLYVLYRVYVFKQYVSNEFYAKHQGTSLKRKWLDEKWWFSSTNYCKTLQYISACSAFSSAENNAAQVSHFTTV